MNVTIQFQSLDRVEGKEWRSKLLHTDSKFYKVLKRIKQSIGEQYQVGNDRMDLHIEISKLRRDPDFRSKAESIHGQKINLGILSNWSYMGRAFVLNTREVQDYGPTHITVAFFGNYPRPDIQVLQNLVGQILEEISD